MQWRSQTIPFEDEAVASVDSEFSVVDFKEVHVSVFPGVEDDDVIGGVFSFANDPEVLYVDTAHPVVSGMNVHASVFPLEKDEEVSCNENILLSDVKNPCVNAVRFC